GVHGPQLVLRAAELAHMAVMHGAEAFRHQHIERAAKHFFLSVAEDLLSAGVEQGYVLPLVKANDGVLGDLYYAAKVLVCSLQRFSLAVQSCCQQVQQSRGGRGADVEKHPE